MYDSITSFTETKERINQDCLLNFKEYQDIQTGFIWSKGELGNLKISQNYNGVSIKGSLAKYSLGNNLLTLTRQTTERAIEKIQDELCIKLNDSKIYRIDIAGNFIMKENYQNYLPSLIDSPYLKKGIIADTLYFSNNRKQLVFYQKPMEMRAKKVLFPECLRKYENNFLRYELRLTKRIKDEFSREIRMKDLYDESFYIEILNKWNDNYFSINKSQNLNLISVNYSTSKDFKEYLILSYISEKGLDQVLNDIDSNRIKFKSSCEASRCKAEIKRLANNKDYAEPNDLILELDEKVRQAVKYYR